MAIQKFPKQFKIFASKLLKYSRYFKIRRKILKEYPKLLSSDVRTQRKGENDLSSNLQIATEKIIDVYIPNILQETENLSREAQSHECILYV